jgi:hypothetical protein
MIQIRKPDGAAIPLAETGGQFVELVNDADGTIMMALFEPRPGAILMVRAGDADVGRYEAMFARQGVKFTPMEIEHDGR